MALTQTQLDAKYGKVGLGTLGAGGTFKTAFVIKDTVSSDALAAELGRVLKEAKNDYPLQAIPINNNLEFGTGLINMGQNLFYGAVITKYIYSKLSTGRAQQIKDYWNNLVSSRGSDFFNSPTFLNATRSAAIAGLVVLGGAVAGAALAPTAVATAPSALGLTGTLTGTAATTSTLGLSLTGAAATEAAGLGLTGALGGGLATSTLAAAGIAAASESTLPSALMAVVDSVTTQVETAVGVAATQEIKSGLNQIFNKAPSATTPQQPVVVKETVNLTPLIIGAGVLLLNLI